MNPRWIC